MCRLIGTQLVTCWTSFLSTIWHSWHSQLTRRIRCMTTSCWRWNGQLSSSCRHCWRWVCCSWLLVAGSHAWTHNSAPTGTCSIGVLPLLLLHPNSPSADPILFLAPEGCHPLFLLRLSQHPICHSHNGQDRHPVYWSPLTCDKWRVPLWAGNTSRNWSVKEDLELLLLNYRLFQSVSDCYGWVSGFVNSGSWHHFSITNSPPSSIQAWLFSRSRLEGKLDWYGLPPCLHEVRQILYPAWGFKHNGNKGFRKVVW